MTGHLLKRGDNLNITVELVDVKNNKSLWGEQYERKMSDLLTTQREIATAITEKLQLKLVGNDARRITKQYTTSNEAYQLYMKGRFHFAKRTKQDLLRSIELFEQAIALDPKYALAYVGLTESWEVMPSFAYMSPEEAMPQARKAIARALEIDPDLAEAHTAYGLILAAYEWDWAGADREFKRSLELDPKIRARTLSLRLGRSESTWPPRRSNCRDETRDGTGSFVADPGRQLCCRLYVCSPI